MENFNSLCDVETRHGGMLHEQFLIKSKLTDKDINNPKIKSDTHNYDVQ